MNALSSIDFASVMDYPPEMKVLDLSKDYDPDYIRSFDWGIGKYNEKRTRMYQAAQFNGRPACAEASAGRRNIHMGIDIWAAAGSAVYAFFEGEIAYFQDNNRPGDYGPTIVTKHRINGQTLFALFGHLSRASIQHKNRGEAVKKGDPIATIGSEEVNGGWAPHLHFQLSVEDPGEADMPGVVADEEHEKALKDYPDPRIVLGEIY